jgi:transcriptional regulator with XRE-family HTH domain
MNYTEKLKTLVGRSGGGEIVAERAGVSRSALFRWMNGETEPRAVHLDFVLRACGYQLKIVPIDKSNDLNAALYESLDKDFATGGLLSERTMRKLSEARRER